MKIFGIYNIKGGVGKTAAAVNLSYLASLDERNTLICDLDPQSSSTFYFRVKPKLKKGAKTILKNEKQIEKSIKATDFDNLDLLPSDFSLRNLDIELDHINKSRKKLSKNLAPLKNEYDYIFLDCPPNITLVSENVFIAADYLLVPVIPTTLSLRTFETLISFLKKEKISLKKVIPFFSMIEIRKKMHQEIIELMHKKYNYIFESKIPYSSIVEKMGIYRRPVVEFSPRSKPSLAFNNLWQEIKRKRKV